MPHLVIRNLSQSSMRRGYGLSFVIMVLAYLVLAWQAWEAPPTLIRTKSVSNPAMDSELRCAGAGVVSIR